MKSLILTIIIISSVFVDLLAQIKYEVKETEQNIRKGFEVLLPGSTVKDADLSLREFLKVYKAKIEYTDKNKIESMAMQTLIPAVNTTPIDLYFNTISIGTDAKFYLYFNLGDLYITLKGTPEKYVAALSIVNQVVGKIAADKAQFQVDSVSNFEKSLEKDLEGLANDKKSIESSMEKNKKSVSENELKIKENERAIEKNKSDQTTFLAQITSEKTFLASMNPDALKERIKSIDGEVKDLQKSNEKANDDIASKKGKITMSISVITSSKTLIESNNKQIETIKTQKSVDAGSGLDPKAVKERVKVLEDQQKDLVKSNEKLMGDNVKSEGDIQTMKSEILTTNNQIQVRQTNIQSKSKEKFDLEQKISNNNLDDRMRKVDEMQKSYEKLQKDQEKFAKEIDVEKAEIDNLKLENKSKETVNIPDNLKAQSIKKVDIEKAKLDLQKVKSIQQTYMDMK